MSSPDLTPTQRAFLPLLTNRLDHDEQADLTPLTIADVERPGRTWTRAPWECDRCGDLYDVQPDARGHMHDGYLLVCVSCGAVAQVSADEDGAHAADPHGVLTEAAHADLYARYSREFAGAYRDDDDLRAALADLGAAFVADWSDDDTAGHDPAAEHEDRP